jgi:hypothetical protein
MKQWFKNLVSLFGLCLVLTVVLFAVLAVVTPPDVGAVGPGRTAWISSTNVSAIGSANATGAVAVVAAQTNANQDRQLIVFSNTSTNSIGIRWSNLYPTNASTQVDLYVPAGHTVAVPLYGYTGAISARAGIDTESGLTISISGN